MGWGSSMRISGGQQVRALPRKFVLLRFGREEPGRTPGVFKKFVRKSSCAFVVP